MASKRQNGFDTKDGCKGEITPVPAHNVPGCHVQTHDCHNRNTVRPCYADWGASHMNKEHKYREKENVSMHC